MNRTRTLLTAVIALWMVLLTVLSVDSYQSGTDSGRAVIGVAAVIAISSAAAALWLQIKRPESKLLGPSLCLSAVAPTGFAFALNVVVLVLGLALVVTRANGGPVGQR